ncbi:RING-H2 finger protein ATL39-like [Corylus avellana]|uniref:RING-H2 finger protein ATL39-like n=1 Tax=Corylus avellana TaxID=13451 RepID=UPI00286CCB40|nr:RING-H2 finger protein ATL39-like [Corylus avellana]
MEVPSPSPGVGDFGGKAEILPHSVYKMHEQNNLFLPIFWGIFASLVVIFFLLVHYFHCRRRQANHNRVEEVEMQQAVNGAVDPDLLSKVIYHPGGSDIPFQQDTCTLCLCNYDDGDELTLLSSCGHAYHNGCIAEHFSRNTTCPVCRKSVSLVLVGSHN